MTEGVSIVSTGLWPFRNHTVTFPKQALDENLNKIFSVDSIKSNEKLHVSLLIAADKDVQFSIIDPIVEFSIKTQTREHFKANERVFSHYLRMIQEGKGLWPNKNEWLCRFNWGRGNANKAVPFSEELPEKTKLIRCETIIENPKEKIEVEVRCLSCNTDFPLTLVIELDSNWK